MLASEVSVEFDQTWGILPDNLQNTLASIWKKQREQSDFFENTDLKQTIILGIMFEEFNRQERNLRTLFTALQGMASLVGYTDMPTELEATNPSGMLGAEVAQVLATFSAAVDALAQSQRAVQEDVPQ